MGSGSGKTTVALGFMAAARARGLAVAPFKVGPDFIDPGHHTRVSGRESRNLDGWMLSCAANLDTFQRGAAHADLAVVEGVMGLFDGYDGRGEAGSTAQMAKWLGIPVVLVVNAASMARSAAALVQGFERFDPGLTFAGVLFNRVGSPRHLDYLRTALEGNVRMPVLGGIPRNEAVDIPERHLGLHTADDHPLSADAVSRLARLVEDAVDVEAFLKALPDVRVQALGPDAPARFPEDRVRVGVARDRAFCFYYPDNLELLEAAGAEIVRFSPLADPSLPEGVCGLYFGGGYPELSAARLARNQGMLEGIRSASRAGMPIYAECGGFMALCRELVDADGRPHAMAGCFPFATRMSPRLRSLGYREVVLDRDCILGTAGLRIRGHEFHYSGLAEGEETMDTVYRTVSRDGGEAPARGYGTGRTVGSYVHLHFKSEPAAAQAFVDACRAYRNANRTDTP